MIITIARKCGSGGREIGRRLSDMLGIAYYDQEIAQKEAEQAEAEANEQAQYELFCQRVRAMEEEGTVSYWSILFNSESFSELLDRLADVDAVMAYDNRVMDELIAARQGYGDVVGIPAPLPWLHLEVNYYLREAFAMVKTFLLD